MKSMHLALAALFAAASATPTLAVVVTFDAQPEVYYAPPVIESGFKFERVNEGFGTNNNSNWPSNGTVHLMTFTNSGSTSGFVLTAVDGSVFKLGKFDFASGFVSGLAPVNTLTVEGYGGESDFIYTFVSGVDFNTSQYSTLSLNGLSAAEVIFTATGPDNRASFDNFILTRLNAVPEPATWAMMILGMGMVGSAMRRKNVKTTPAYSA